MVVWVLQLCSSVSKLFWLIGFPLPFYINFRINLSISEKKHLVGFCLDCIESIGEFGKN